MEKKAKLGVKNWMIIVVLCTLGQIAWTIENSWFSTFMYDEVTHSSTPIAIMVGASAVVATATAWFMGTVSDRLGKRKPFIMIGYCLWGISTMLYPLCSWAKVVNIAIALVVFMDCVMTFFGSVAYDSAFNAWTTDITTPQNRGSVVGIMQVCPLVASLLMGGSGAIIDSYGYFVFFLIFGGIVTGCGLLFGALLKESPDIKPVKKGTFKEQLFSVFNIHTITENRELFLVLTSYMFIMAAYQIVGSYDTIYLNNYLGISYTVVSLISLVSLPATLVGSLAAGFISNKGHGHKAMILSVALFAVGSFMIACTNTMVPLMVAKGLQMLGMMSMVVAATVEFKNLLPQNQNGQFEGVRMIFVNLIPMVIGPAIGSALISLFGIQTVIEGEAATVPTPIIYVACGICGCLAFITLGMLKKERGR